MSSTSEQLDLDGTVAVVTGAASGIGLALAEALVGEGVSVVMADVDGETLHEHRERLAADGHRVHAVPTDVTDADAVERLAETAVDRFGDLHIAVNNAGIVNRGVTWELSLEDWRQVFDVDLWGVIHGVRAFVPRILASGAPGHVVNVASMAAVLPVDRLGPYTAAKHAVLGLSDVLRLDLEGIGAPVGVSVVFPGRIRTGMNPYGEVGAETVARHVVDAIRGNRPYVYTDDHSREEVEARLGSLLGARDGSI